MFALQLTDKLQIALREAQRAAVIKDERDAGPAKSLPPLANERLLERSLARNREKEKQLVDRFNALIDEGRYDEALGCGTHDQRSRSDRRDAGRRGCLDRISWPQRLPDAADCAAPAGRITFDTLYEVEKSSVPFPDDPPIVYPAAPIWEELSNRRKDRYGSMDLKATGEAEQRIEKALRSPLHSTGLDFTDQPLQRRRQPVAG